MAKYARILEINNEQILLGLLNDKGLCGSASCEGCSCSTKEQTMRVNTKGTQIESSQLTIGSDVEMKLPKGTYLDWFLLIFLPIILVVSSVFLFQRQSEDLRNMIALASGLLGFTISALILKIFRKNQSIVLIPLNQEAGAESTVKN